MAPIVLMTGIGRRTLTSERVFRDRINPLDVFDDVELFTKFRFRCERILSRTDAIHDEI